MHVVLILDHERMLHEQVMLNRLAIGLIDEGLRVTRLVPEDIEDTSPHGFVDRMGLIRRLTYPTHVSAWARKRRVRRLQTSLERDAPDVIMAVGHDTWEMALDYGHALDLPVAVDIWDEALLGRLPRQSRRGVIGAYVVPTMPLANRLRQLVEPTLISLVPFGVAPPKEPQTIFKSVADSISCVVIGPGRDPGAFDTMLSGIEPLIRDFPQLQIVIELRGTNDHTIWQLAQKRNMLSRISTITDASYHRKMILACDCMLIPEPLGRMRSMLLEAMGQGMLIMASHDPVIDVLSHGETAVILRDASPDAWEQALRRTFTDLEWARSLGGQAHDCIRQQHRSSAQAAQLIHTFEQMLRGETIAFPQTDQ